MRSKNLYGNVEAAIAAVIAFLISMVPLQIGPSFGIQLSLVAIYIVAFRRGVRVGVMAGFLFGLLQLITGFGQILSPLQGFIEYIFAFLFAGLAGLYAVQTQTAVEEKDNKQLLFAIGKGTFIAIITEYFIHFLAGVAFWGQYAPEGMGPWVYSGIMNSGSALATWIATYAVAYILIRTNKKLVIANQ
jgi:thiamine transporter